MCADHMRVVAVCQVAMIGGGGVPAPFWEIMKVVQVMGTWKPYSN